MIKLGSNIASLVAQRRLNEASDAVSKVYERLASGMRINRASDDPAGLAVAESLNASRRVFTQGIRNLNDGVSLLSIADSAIESLSTIVTRLSELAAQSANGTYSTTQRQALDAEAQSLSEEYFRIVRSTKYNGRGLFYGDFGELRLQAGYGSDGGIQSGLGGAIGTGYFEQLASTTLGANVGALAVGDLNGDGHQDIVATTGTTANVLLGSGTGGFSLSQQYSIDAAANSLFLKDLNLDGTLDLVSAGSGITTVRLGSGSGTFGLSTSYTLDATAHAALDDLDGDGNLDLVAFSIITGSAAVLYGTSSGQFSAATTLTMTGGGPSGDVQIGDFNGDGIMDIAATGSFGSAVVSVRFGTGGRTFSAASVVTSGITTAGTLRAGDFNNDGYSDLFVAGTTTGGAAVLLGSAAGLGGAGVMGAYAAVMLPGAAIGDLNGDGNLDLSLTRSTGQTDILLGNGNGSFSPHATYSMGLAGGVAAALGDFNEDGVLDILSGGSNSTFGVRLQRTVDGITPLLPFSLGTLAGARQALPVFEQTLNRLALQRGEIGAFQSRIDVASNTLQSFVENYAAAESRIRDADTAQDAAELVRLSILQQAASAVLAQANQLPALALKLLED